MGRCDSATPGGDVTPHADGHPNYRRTNRNRVEHPYGGTYVDGRASNGHGDYQCRIGAPE